MYRENNINFRIASAGAISEFKSLQANAFLQVCRKEFDFGLSARETVLLSYERLSKWLLNVERDFVLEPEQEVTYSTSRLMISSFQSELELIASVCKDNPQIFSADILHYLEMIHTYALPMITDAFGRALKNTPSRAFIAISNHLGDYLQHVLISMHEFNNNIVLRRQPFVCVSEFSMLEPAKFTALKARAQFFKSFLGQECSFIVKNYCTSDIHDAPLIALKSIGVSAQYEKLEIPA